MTFASSKIDINKLKNLYLMEGRSTLDLARYFNVSIDVVTYAMRKHNIPRRDFKEASKRSFENKKMTFKRKRVVGLKKAYAESILAMLYWGEGFKGNENSKMGTFDFANSDPVMVRVFMKAFRDVYEFDKDKIRAYIYCYSNQDVSSIIDFWSKLTMIPKSQFTKPYIRNDSKVNAREMKYGLIHIRYHDKKLLINIKNLIECVCDKYAPVE
ncbi:MAG: hypothetical protein WCP24_03140 [bacterium]